MYQYFKPIVNIYLEVIKICIKTNERNKFTVSKGKWVIYEIDEGIQFIHENGANFVLGHDLIEKIWEYLDHGEQPLKQNQSWYISADEWDGGLIFEKHIESSRSYWGITGSGLKALLEWRDMVYPTNNP